MHVVLVVFGYFEYKKSYILRLWHKQSVNVCQLCQYQPSDQCISILVCTLSSVWNKLPKIPGAKQETEFSVTPTRAS